MKRKRPESWQGRPVLTRESIGREVLEILASEGVDSFSTRRLAQRLKVSPRALYNYVSGRDDAVAAAAVVAQGDFEFPTLDEREWPDAIRDLCNAYRAWHARYPGLLRLAGNVQIPAHPEMVRANEQALRFLREIGLDDADAGGAWTVLLTTLAGFAEVDAWFVRVGAAAEAPPASSGVAALTEAEFPNTLAVHRAGADVGADATFGRTVEMIIAWIASLRRTPESERD